MNQVFKRNQISLLIAAVLATGAAPVAMADDTQIQQMQDEIHALEQRLEQLQTQQSQQSQQDVQVQQQVQQLQAGTEPRWAHRVAPTDDNTIHTGSISIKLGGFLANETAYRSVDLQSSINSPYLHIPYAPPNTTNFISGTNNVYGTPVINNGIGSYYNQSEFRDTAQQSRFSLLAQGNANPNTLISGYYEMDFLGAANTANSNESNSYNLRIRNIYSTIDWLDSGWHMLAGQSWSLATLNTHGITPRNEEIPLTIDAQYVPGFVWARQPQLRITKDWDQKWWVAVSIENPQTSNVGGANAGVNEYANAPIGGGLYDYTTNYSVNKYPDVIAKLAAETDFGHFEVLGMMRNFQSVYALANNTAGNQQNEWAGSMGVGAVIPVIPKQLEVNLNALYGDGVGRYGTSGLPDASYSSSGALNPLTGGSALLGIVWHTNPKLDLYFNAGQDFVDSSTNTSANGTVYGYGNNVSNANQFSPYTKSVTQETLGMWWSAYKGAYGVAKLGLQYSHTTLSSFNVSSTIGSLSTSDNIALTSMRYYPF